MNILRQQQRLGNVLKIDFNFSAIAEKVVNMTPQVNGAEIMSSINYVELRIVDEVVFANGGVTVPAWIVVDTRFSSDGVEKKYN